MKFPCRCLLVVGALMTGCLLLVACDKEEEGTAATPSGSPEAVEESPAPADTQEEEPEQSTADVHLILSQDSVEASPDRASAGSVTFVTENQTDQERAWVVVRLNREVTIVVEEGYTDIKNHFDPEPVGQGILAAGASHEFMVDLAPVDYMVVSWPTPPAGAPGDGRIRITSARENLILIDGQWVSVSSCRLEVR